MQWTVLNSAISLLGYWTAAVFVDKPWYGRMRMQVRGAAGLLVLHIFGLQHSVCAGRLSLDSQGWCQPSAHARRARAALARS